MPSFHSITHQAALDELKSGGQKGLPSGEAARRLLEHGYNELKEAPKKGLLAMFFEQFTDLLVVILIIAAVISGFLGEWIDAGAIIAIVILNAVVGLVQDYRAEKALDALKKMVAPTARVVRDGVEKRIAARELVPGDVIILEAGDQVPADCRLLESMSLQLSEATLTGESAPVGKDAEAVFKEKTAVADRDNSVFLGTIVTRGIGRAVVTATGMRTEFGKIASQVQAVEEELTPLQQKLEVVGKRLAQASLAIVAVVFVVGVARGFPLVDMFLTSVSLAVAAVPEGLPAIVTITLALGVQRMAGRNAIMRKLRAVETLGSADVIATDKTGTLTRNEMTVRKLFFSGAELDVTGTGYALNGGFQTSGQKFDTGDDGFIQFLRAGALCTSARLESSGHGVANVIGDPTEGALLVLGEKAGVGKDGELRQYKRVYELPFESERKMMSTIHAHGSKRYAFVKGAPETVLDHADRILTGGKVRKMTLADKKLLLAKNNEFASKALRVLAVAYREVPKAAKYSDKQVEQKLIFLGIVGMIDPPREEVKSAIALCKTAGIRVVMVTGDNPLTAGAIARELGLPVGLKPWTGLELDELADKEFEETVLANNVFARVSPEHKLRIVGALKKHGHVVAMTGDGVNDAPALKKADIGIAMGITGTDVTKEASDMVLADDNFASIVNAVREGRIIYDNIVKSIYYLLTCNVGEIIAIFVATLLGWPMPLLPIQILWMNLVTDGLPALALGMDPEEPGVMDRQPRSRNEEILSPSNGAYLLAIGSIIAIGTLGLFAFELFVDHSSLEKARSMAFSTIIFFQFFHALNSRSRTSSLFSIGVFKNKLLWLAIFAGIVLQVLITQTSILEAVFKVEPLSLLEWGTVIAVSSSVFVIYELWKYFKRRGTVG
jgi:Ca2+-transporting ATPase